MTYANIQHNLVIPLQVADSFLFFSLTSDFMCLVVSQQLLATHHVVPLVGRSVLRRPSRALQTLTPAPHLLSTPQQLVSQFALQRTALLILLSPASTYKHLLIF